jgi:hypothetical protein
MQYIGISIRKNPENLPANLSRYNSFLIDFFPDIILLTEKLSRYNSFSREKISRYNPF